MQNVSGSFSGRATTQAIISPQDTPNHGLNLLEVAGVQKTSDDNWSDAKITYWGTADLVDGSGPQRGYFVNVHSNGDRVRSPSRERGNMWMARECSRGSRAAARTRAG